MANHKHQKPKKNNPFNRFSMQGNPDLRPWLYEKPKKIRKHNAERTEETY